MLLRRVSLITEEKRNVKDRLHSVSVKYVINVVCDDLWQFVDCSVFEVRKVKYDSLLRLLRHCWCAENVGW